MAVITVKKGLIGKEDMSLGTGTFSRAKSDGSTQTLNQINAEDFITLPAGTRTVTTTTNYLANNAVHNVKDYGAVGDGVVDDGAAITLAVRAALASGGYGNSVVYFPTGVYRVTTTGVLSDLGVTGQFGLAYVGDGRLASLLLVDPPATTDIWLYDNNSTEVLQHVTFRDLGFFGSPSGGTGYPAWAANTYSSISQYAKGFKIENDTGDAHEGRFHFHDCWFGLLDTAVEFAGVTGGSLSDENVFVACQFNRIRTASLSCTNPQSVCNSFHGCHFTLQYGDLLNISGGGGGPFNFHSSSITMDADDGPDTLKYVVNMSSTNQGASMGPINFYGAAVELRLEKTGIVAASDASGFGNVHFNGCRFLSTAVASKTVVTIDERKIVKFDTCVFYNNTAAAHQKFHIETTAANGGNSGRIRFVDCQYPESRTAGVIDADLSDQCSLASSYGMIEAIGTSGGNGTTTAEPYTVSQDFNLGGSSSGNWAPGVTDPSIRMKTVLGKKSSLFPELSGGASVAARESTIRLPKNAVIKNIYAIKEAQGSDTNAYVLRVTNNDGTTVHCSSGSAARNTKHTASTTDLFLSVGSTENERILRMDCTGTGTSTEDQANGIWLIEYY